LRPLDESLVNLSVDLVQPLFSAVSFISIKLNVGLELSDPILGRAKLMRKLLCHIQGVSAVFLSHAGGFVKQAQNGLPGFIELIAIS
jgi:hypothetical protein